LWLGTKREIALEDALPSFTKRSGGIQSVARCRRWKI